MNRLIKVHFLLLGKSPGHLDIVLNHYHIDKMILFSSKEIEEDVIDLLNENEPLNEFDPEVIYLQPFDPGAVEEMTERILEVERRIKIDYPDSEIIAGLTGGTNLMAISMAIAAQQSGWRCHYVKKGEDGESDEIIMIDYFHRSRSE